MNQTSKMIIFAMCAWAGVSVAQAGWTADDAENPTLLTHDTEGWTLTVSGTPKDLKLVKFTKNEGSVDVDLTELGADSPYTLTVCGNGAFCKNEIVETIRFPASTVNIEKGSGSGYAGLGNGTGAFASTGSNSSKIRFVDMPGVTNVGSYAFWSMQKLEGVNMPELRSVEDYGFTWSKWCFHKANFPKLEKIGIYGFYECAALTNFFAPNVLSVGDNAFSCYRPTQSLWVHVKDFDMPLLTNAGASAFSYCRAAKNMNFPKLVKAGSSAFSNFSTPPAVTNLNLRSVLTTPLNCKDFALLESVDFSSVGSLPNDMFNGCTNLTTVAPFLSLTSSGSQVFLNAKKLTSIEIPLLPEIGFAHFAGCSNLTHVSAPSLRLISAKGNGTYCSAFSRCPLLRHLKLPWCMEDISGRNPFNQLTEGITLYVHNSSPLATNFTDAQIRTKATSDGMPDKKLFIVRYGGTETIDGAEWVYDDVDENYAVSADSVTIAASPNVTGAVVMPSRVAGKNVTAIESVAFRSCTGLTSMRLGRHVQKVGLMAFPKTCMLEVWSSSPQSMIAALKEEYGEDHVTVKKAGFCIIVR